MAGKDILSEREIEILQLVASGMTNREIAQALSISPNTVKVHLRNIFEKINVASRTEATLYGIEHGLVDVPGSEESINQPSSLNMVQNTPWLFLAMILVIVLIVAFSSNALFSSPTPTPVTLSDFSDRWEELAPIPEPRAGMATATYNSNIYTIAGEGPQGVSNSVYRYITSEDRWEQLRDKPTPVADVEGVLVGEKIYIPGGRLANGEITDVLEVYDPRKDSWERKTSVPIRISGYALADYEGQIYLFGGWDGEKVLDIVFRYDPLGDQWESMTPMPTKRAYAGAVEAGGEIYVIGGWNGKEWLDVNESFNPIRDMQNEQAWLEEISLPQREKSLSVESLSNMLFVIGNDNIWQFNISEDNWIKILSNNELIENDYFSTSITPEGYIYLLRAPKNQLRSEATTYRFRVVYTISIPSVIN